MFPPMPKAPTLPGAKPLPEQQATLPGVEPLGGGAIQPPQIQPIPQGIEPPERPAAQPFAPRSAGPMMPEPMTATAMPKPMGEGPLAKPTGASPQGAAKPQQAGPMAVPEGMPPPIRAPRPPNYQPQTPTAPGINPNQPAPYVGALTGGAGQFDVDAFRPFADAVYSEATRQLDPAMQQREADFRQRMVNQGLQEGTEAYDKAFANFSRERNDAYGSARNQALAQALGAQNQFFGQSATNAQMVNQMGQFNASNALQDRNSLASLGLQAQGMGMQDRQFGAGLGLQYGQLGQQAQLANAANWINQNQFGRNMEFGRERADMQDLMGLLGYGQQTTAFNNSQLAQDQQRAMALFGLIPGLAPTQLDVMGPANQFMQMQNANINAANSRSNGLFGALGQLGGSALGGAMQFGWGNLLSDIRAKKDIQRVGTLDNGIPVYLYRYKFGGPFHIGVMAQEVEQTKPEAVREHEGIKYVDYAEAVK